MKYILTERQLKLISEDSSLWVKRRLSSIEDFILSVKKYYSKPCDEFSDEFEYADNIISRAIDEFLLEDESFDLGENFDEIHSEILDYCKVNFGEELINFYRAVCKDYD